MGSIMTLRRARRFDVQQQTVYVFHDQQKRKRRNGKSFNLTSVEVVIVMVHGNVVRILQFLKVLACIAYVHQRRF